MTKAPGPDETGMATQARLVAVVLVATMILWQGALYLGARFGWDGRYAVLFDLAALAAFVWSLAVTWRLWQRRRDGTKG